MKNPALSTPFGPAGAKLWTDVLDALVLDAHEERLLVELCRTADTLDALQAVVDRDGVLSESSQGVRAHPALQELRQQRIAFARLVAALDLPEGMKKPRGVYRIAGA